MYDVQIILIIGAGLGISLLITSGGVPLLTDTDTDRERIMQLYFGTNMPTFKSLKISEPLLKVQSQITSMEREIPALYNCIPNITDVSFPLKKAKHKQVKLQSQWTITRGLGYALCPLKLDLQMPVHLHTE